ncbi:hypothetical protein BWK59_00535 [Flavobacterium davisii]|uniref:Uncharacterized protein n=1 Tax=Flavobacterium davisii TaxID=2906077 RepID=A0A246GLP6_9FLAO|nr:hypothetical protein [Flavobacterium davisii]OWP85373.1 hypothetical protein BWK59_00535 [Flavobacterium davisii]
MITLDHNNLSENVKHAYNLSEKFNKESRSKITLGSDEHLDIISQNTEVFNQLIGILSLVNNLVEKNFPSDKQEAEELKLALHSLHSSLDLFVNKIKVSDSSYSESVIQLEAETAQIVEYINDINDFILFDEEFISDDFFAE